MTHHSDSSQRSLHREGFVARFLMQRSGLVAGTGMGLLVLMWTATVALSTDEGILVGVILILWLARWSQVAVRRTRSDGCC
jgi:hypothetical protein